MKTETWQAAGIGISVAIALLAGNAHITRMVVKSEVTGVMVTALQTFATKAELEHHVEIFHGEAGK